MSLINSYNIHLHTPILSKREYHLQNFAMENLQATKYLQNII